MTTADTIALQLTPSGKAFMTLVGQKHFDFFDGGIVAGEGNWGPNMASQAAGTMGKTARSLGGIMARLASPELGLWNVEVQDDGQGKDEAWWTLTELGAEVANLLAEQAHMEQNVEGVKELREELEAEVPGKARAHAGCAHPRTKAARAACRRAAAKIDREGAKPAPVIEAPALTEAEHRTEMGWDAVEEGAAFDADLDAQLEIEELRDLEGDAYADAVLAELESLVR